VGKREKEPSYSSARKTYRQPIHHLAKKRVGFIGEKKNFLFHTSIRLVLVISVDTPRRSTRSVGELSVGKVWGITFTRAIPISLAATTVEVISVSGNVRTTHLPRRRKNLQAQLGVAICMINDSGHLYCTIS